MVTSSKTSKLDTAVDEPDWPAPPESFNITVETVIGVVHLGKTGGKHAVEVAFESIAHELLMNDDDTFVFRFDTGNSPYEVRVDRS